MKNLVVRVAGMAAILIVVLAFVDFIHVCIASMDIHLVDGGIQNAGGSSQFWIPWGTLLPWIGVIYLIAMVAAFIVELRSNLKK
jgi:hypothetical protein